MFFRTIGQSPPIGTGERDGRRIVKTISEQRVRCGAEPSNLSNFDVAHPMVTQNQLQDLGSLV